MNAHEMKMLENAVLEGIDLSCKTGELYYNMLGLCYTGAQLDYAGYRAIAEDLRKFADSIADEKGRAEIIGMAEEMETMTDNCRKFYEAVQAEAEHSRDRLSAFLAKVKECSDN